MSQPVLRTSGLTKTFGTTTALDGVDLAVAPGTVMALLGHNGAGKTTLVNIVSTLTRPTAGSASVAGFDVATQADQVRSRIGLTGQFASVDESLSATANLVLIARLLGAGRRAARARADQLLEVFDLTEAANRRAKTYSGGMRRRLDLAASLVGHPEMIFLDEPTTGLDPLSRIGLWEIVEDLVRDGTTVLLTTQYLEEADRLADAVTVLSKGRVIAAGTTAELKAGVGDRTVHITLPDADQGRTALAALTAAGLHPTPDEAGTRLATPAASTADLTAVVRILDRAGLEISELTLTEPTLDDVYLALNSPATAGKSL